MSLTTRSLLVWWFSLQVTQFFRQLVNVLVFFCSFDLVKKWLFLVRNQSLESMKSICKMSKNIFSNNNYRISKILLWLSFVWMVFHSNNRKKSCWDGMLFFQQDQNVSFIKVGIRISCLFYCIKKIFQIIFICRIFVKKSQEIEKIIC